MIVLTIFKNSEGVEEDIAIFLIVVDNNAYSMHKYYLSFEG